MPMPAETVMFNVCLRNRFLVLETNAQTCSALNLMRHFTNIAGPLNLTPLTSESGFSIQPA
jgi:hypothetical protein